MKEECEALEVARHELVTLNGLRAYDGAVPDYTWTLDTRPTIRLIDEALALSRPNVQAKSENQGEDGK